MTTPKGSITASYGSFGTADLALNLGYGGQKWGNFISASGLNSGRFLDPPEFAVIDGEEVSTASGHYLALGVSDSRWIRGPGYDARALMASSRAHGAVNFIAHPYGLRDRWSDWGAQDYDGIEIFNDDAIWRKNKIIDIAIAALIYPVNSRLALLRLARTPNENFAKWDELLAERPVAGICGSDAHANLLFDRFSVAHFPSYLSVFSLARQHVLVPAHRRPSARWTPWRPRRDSRRPSPPRPLPRDRATRFRGEKAKSCTSKFRQLQTLQ